MAAFVSEHLATLVVAAVVLGAIIAFVRGWWLGYPPSSREAVLLSAKEQAIVVACADALVPAGGALALSGSQAGAVAYIDQMLRGFPKRQRVLLRLLLRFVEHGPWIFAFERRLTRQSPEQRSRTFEQWRTSRVYFLRASFTSLRTVLTLAYLANPQVIATLRAEPNTDPFNLARAP